MATSKLTYVPVDKVILPPANAEVLTTACDYCVVACGYKIYRWPIGQEGGPKKHQNAFGVDFPVSEMQEWVAPTQINQVIHNGKEYNIVILPDKDTGVVNLNGDSSIRGGTLAEKCYNKNGFTRDRLKKPLVRVNGKLKEVSWDFALDIAAEIGQYVIKKYGRNAYSVKTFSYAYFENTYAITKFALRNVNTASFTWHNTPSNVTSTPGFKDAGFDNFSASYEDWGNADVLMMCGTDPYETKTIVYTQHIKPAIDNGQKVIFLNPRQTAGIAYGVKQGGIHIDLYPGTDLLVVNAMARIIVENGWEDSEWIRKWVNNKWETDSGLGRGTKNIRWQWRTTRSKLKSKGFEDWKKWLLEQEEFELENAARISGVYPAKIAKAATWIAKPIDGRRPKTSIGIEKGFYSSNNTGNTEAIGALAALIGTGGRKGRMISRFGGHQLGGISGGKYSRNKSPEKSPGRRRRALDTDRYLTAGHTRLAYVIGTTWIQSMMDSSSLNMKFQDLVTDNPYQVTSLNKNEIIATLKKRVDSGGMTVINQDIYLIDPVGAKYADIIFPASGWGEENFMRANGERRIRLYQKFYDPPGEAKPDWWIVAKLARKMGFDGFDWNTSNDVAEEAARFSRGDRKDFYMIKIDAQKKGITLHERMRQFGTTGIQGPVLMIKGELRGTTRLHDTERELPADDAQSATIFNKKLTHFNTPTGKINMMKSPWNLFSDFFEWISPKGDELRVTNGRINEKWQSGYDDTDRSPYKKQRLPENWVEINPADAKKRGIKSGDQVIITSDRVPVQKDIILGIRENDSQFSSLKKNGHIELLKASVKAIAIVTPAIKQGVLFIDFLDKRQPSNAIQARVVDPISGNYNYKMGVGKIKKIGGSKYQKEFSEMTFVPRNIT